MLQDKEINVMENSESRNISNRIPWTFRSSKSLHNNKSYPRSLIVLSSLALLLDIFVIILMLWKNKLRQRPANKFLLNLLISDGIVCISLISCEGQLLAIWDDRKSFVENYYILQSFVVFLYVAVVLSMLNLTLITLDRLIAVKWPFIYEEKVHTKQSFIAIAVVWGITIAFAVVMTTLFNVLHPQTSRLIGNATFVAVVLTGFITLLVSNSFVFVEARTQLKAIEKVAYSIEIISLESSDNSNHKEKEFRKKEFRLVKNNIGLILCFFLFWINTLVVAVNMLVYADEVDPPIPLEYVLASWYLVHIYYICNPLWYVALSYDVKREVKQIFLKKQLEC